MATITLNITRPTHVLYGSDYGIVADADGLGGGTDNTAAFNTFMAACKAGQKKGELASGLIGLGSKPNDIDFIWDLGGKGINTTQLIRNYSEAGGDSFIDIILNSGTRIHNLSVYAASGTTGGTLVRAICPSNFAISHFALEDIIISSYGTDTHASGLVIDGRLRTISPIGSRVANLKNVHVFGSTDYSVYLLSLVGLNWFGGGVYPASGNAAASGAIYLSGVPTVKSQYVTIDIITCNGLNLTQCLNVKIDSANIGSVSGNSILTDSTCSLTQVTGALTGAFSGSWVTSGIRRPNAAWSAT